MPENFNETSLSGYLDVIGKFIGTYGLAVFLVVFYVTTLYSYQQDERREWISEITKLRTLVDPEAKILTNDQAEKILRISLESFMQQLSSNTYDGLYSWGGGTITYPPSYSFGDSAIPKTIPFFSLNKVYKFPLDTTVGMKEYVVAINSEISRFNEVMEGQRRLEINYLEEVYAQTKQEYQLVSTLLYQLNIENSNLRQVWDDIERDGDEKWRYLVSKVQLDFIQNEKIDLEDFLRQLPNYSSIKEDLVPIYRTNEEGRDLSLTETISEMREHFNSKIKSSLSLEIQSK